MLQVQIALLVVARLVLMIIRGAIASSFGVHCLVTGAIDDDSPQPLAPRVGTGRVASPTLALAVAECGIGRALGGVCGSGRCCVAKATTGGRTSGFAD